MTEFLSRAQLEEHRRRLGLPETCLAALIDPGDGECLVYLQSFQDGLAALGLLAQALNQRQDLMPASFSPQSRQMLAIFAEAFRTWSEGIEPPTVTPLGNVADLLAQTCGGDDDDDKG